MSNHGRTKRERGESISKYYSYDGKANDVDTMTDKNILPVYVKMNQLGSISPKRMSDLKIKKNPFTFGKSPG